LLLHLLQLELLARKELREHGLLHWRAVTMDPAAIKRKCGLEIVDVSARLVKF